MRTGFRPREPLVMVRRSWLPIAGAAVIMAAACARPPRPNILLIVVDTARADRFTTNGYGRDTTPVTGALGREGAVFLNAYAPSPWTLPSHASLFTGLHPSAHGADSGRLRLDEKLPFLARRLKEGGYRTLAYVGNPWVGKDYNFHPGFDTFDEIWRGVRGTEGDMGAGVVSSKVERWLAWRDQNDDARSEPFFLFINYFEPHLPYNPPDPERTRFTGPTGAGETGIERLRRFKHPEEVRQILGAGSLTAADFRQLSDLYDGEIAYVDRRIGEVVDALRRRALLDRTVVVVTSDHGEMLGEHGFMDHKFTLYEPVLRIPMIVRYPAGIPAGQRVESPVLLQDLYPTLLALAGLPGRASRGSVPEEGSWPPEALPLPGVQAPGSPPNSGRARNAPLIAEFARPGEFLEVMKGLMPGLDPTPWDRALVAFRVGQTKLIWASDGGHRLYDLEADPGEAADLAPGVAGSVSDLAGRVEGWLHRPAARFPALWNGKTPPNRGSRSAAEASDTSAGAAARVR